MFSGHNAKTILVVIMSLNNHLGTKHIAASREALKRYNASLKGEEKIIFDKILSCVIQSSFKYKRTHFNMLPFKDDVLDKVDEVIKQQDNNTYKELPHIAQQLVSLCTDLSRYRTPTDTLRKLLNKFYIIENNTETIKCKRCYKEIEYGVLCDECVTKLEHAVEHQAESFTTGGTSVESFNYQFKDWSVDINKYGTYTFTRLDVSDKVYQPKLPFKELQNLSMLIG